MEKDEGCLADSLVGFEGSTFTASHCADADAATQLQRLPRLTLFLFGSLIDWLIRNTFPDGKAFPEPMDQGCEVKKEENLSEFA